MTELRVSVSNVGGIDDLDCSFEDPVNVVTGPNASNKTSLLQAIAFGLGRPTIPIKNDAEEARVELEVDGERVVRTARATPDGHEISGEGLLTSPEAIELLERFACLFEFNEVRAAVRAAGDFEEALKAPMNLDELERERSEKVERKRQLRADVEQLDGVDEELAARREALDEARRRVEKLEAELDDLRERQADASTGDEEVETLREERAALVRKRNEHENGVADLEASVDRIDERIDDLDERIDEAREEADRHDVEGLRAERDEVARELEDIEDRFEVLQSVLTANRELYRSPYAGVLGQDAGLVEDTITCWACGNEATEADFEETLDRLGEVVERDRQRRREHEPRLRELEAEIEAAEGIEQRISELRAERRDLEERRESRRDSLATKRERLSAIRDELADLDEELAAREDERQSDVTGLTDEIERVQDDLYDARREATRLESEIEDLEADREQRRRKQERIEELSAEIAELTDRIEHLEDDLRASFNEAMDDLLAVLDYENVSRVWLDGSFELVVSREVDGVERRDSLSHLSESEREMVGLVLALAGYVAYDVAESVPVLMMDTLGAFDATRTADLVAYFAEEAPLLAVILLPESAEAVAERDVDHRLVRPGDLAAPR